MTTQANYSIHAVFFPLLGFIVSPQAHDLLKRARPAFMHDLPVTLEGMSVTPDPCALPVHRSKLPEYRRTVVEDGDKIVVNSTLHWTLEEWVTMLEWVKWEMKKKETKK